MRVRCGLRCGVLRALAGVCVASSVASAADVQQQALPERSDYPAVEVQSVPPAAAAAAAARMRSDFARREVQRVVDTLRQDLASSREYVAAMAEEREAYAAYDAERKRVLDHLSDDAQYAALAGLTARLGNEIRNAHPGSDATTDQWAALVPAASMKLSYAQGARQLEMSALAGDEQVRAAWDRLVAAGQRVHALRADMDRAVRRDEQFLAARKSYEDARIASVASAALLRSALVARDVALDYYRYLYRTERFFYGPDYIAADPLGYPYGYRYGYGYTYR